MIIFIFSCNVKNHNVPKEISNEVKDVKKDKLKPQLEEIGNLYKPEEISVKENKVGNDFEKQDFQITLTNSDSIDGDLKNVDRHAEKIALLYHSFLEENVGLVNVKMILVNINHRNTTTHNFKYTLNDINKLQNSK